MKNVLTLTLGLLVAACSAPEIPGALEKSNYLDYSQRDDKWTGGVKVIPVETALGTFNVWTKRVGNNPDLKEQRGQHLQLILEDIGLIIQVSVAETQIEVIS
jgi:hypothetical protein